MFFKSTTRNSILLCCQICLSFMIVSCKNAPTDESTTADALSQNAERVVLRPEIVLCNHMGKVERSNGQEFCVCETSIVSTYIPMSDVLSNFVGEQEKCNRKRTKVQTHEIRQDLAHSVNASPLPQSILLKHQQNMAKIGLQMQQMFPFVVEQTNGPARQSGIQPGFRIYRTWQGSYDQKNESEIVMNQSQLIDRISSLDLNQSIWLNGVYISAGTAAEPREVTYQILPLAN